MSENAVLLISCPDRRGLIASVTDFVYTHNGNIEHSDQHVDLDNDTFFMRIEWSLEGFDLNKEVIGREFEKIAQRFEMDWELDFTRRTERVAIFVSDQLHCLYELLYRYESDQLDAEISLIISNRSAARELAGKYGIDFHHVPVDPENRQPAEAEQRELLREYEVDTIVLARYMRILSPEFVDAYRWNIINIHHSFLPAFVGSKPYLKAYRRGVKIIGATSHYVTEELDAGPIIEQDVVRISHRDSVEDLREKGRDLEKLVLSRALNWHLKRKILVYESDERAKTVIFD